MAKILIIDDDIAICELVKINLELQGHACIYSTDPIRGFALVKQEIPNLVVLDVMMGAVSGYDVAQKIRKTPEISKTPIIMLTALGELNNKLEGFSVGVDDYITKPFEIEELKARVLALLNRSGAEIASLRVKEVLSKGDITLIPESYSVQILDKKTQLTPIEFDILNVLMQYEGSMVSSKTLLREVWGYDEDNDVDTIRVHITHLRSKINKISSEKNKYIKTIYGGGYRLLADGIEK
ncbi:MAG: response regulator transcription factor [Candidatus Gastranaerophilales bacterium]|nr:response regulator transcription factor [Candidatus Gastranaerophilales bacterium]